MIRLNMGMLVDFGTEELDDGIRIGNDKEKKEPRKKGGMRINWMIIVYK